MKIAFLDNLGLAYDVDTPLNRPLGGTQSAVCYVAAELAARGHEVTLLNEMVPVRTVRGVRCDSRNALAQGVLADLDVLVIVSVADRQLYQALRASMPTAARLVLWTGHAPDERSIAGLADPETHRSMTATVAVSDWQRQRFIEAFGIPAAQIVVLRNAMSPAFADLFGGGPIGPAKADPPVLAYTSAPGRGLDRLLPAFERIRGRFPDVRLRVFSSLVGYNVMGAADPFAALYLRCRMTPGVEYVGSLAQAALAAELKAATLLAYPNTFAETSCIAAMEAMAAGLMIVTSDHGALPETCHGFADLVPLGANRQVHTEAFADAVIAALERRRSDPAAVEARLAAQVAFANARYGWAERGREWHDWLTG